MEARSSTEDGRCAGGKRSPLPNQTKPTVERYTGNLLDTLAFFLASRKPQSVPGPRPPIDLDDLDECKLDDLWKIDLDDEEEVRRTVLAGVEDLLFTHHTGATTDHPFFLSIVLSGALSKGGSFTATSLSEHLVG
jgi:hypothetical protein